MKDVKFVIMLLFILPYEDNRIKINDNLDDNYQNI